MTVLLRVLSFSLLMIFAFTTVTWVLPQRRGDVPVENPVIDTTSMSMSAFIALGKTVYQEKGNCTLCHNSLGRAPDLLAVDMVAISLERLAEGSYQGVAKTAESYLRESMIDPGAYVVKGFGKLGSNDTESPMPAVDKPPTELSMIEINAVIAYLQDKDQHKITVALPSQTAPPTAQQISSSQMNLTSTGAETADQLLAKYACVSCHRIGESTATIGPDLRGLGQRQTLAQIRDSIIAPAAVVVEGYAPIMPDYSERMSVRELELLSQFLWQEHLWQEQGTDTTATLSASAADGELPPL